MNNTEGLFAHLATETMNHVSRLAEKFGSQIVLSLASTSHEYHRLVCEIAHEIEGDYDSTKRERAYVRRVVDAAYYVSCAEDFERRFGPLDSLTQLNIDRAEAAIAAVECELGVMGVP